MLTPTFLTSSSADELRAALGTRSTWCEMPDVIWEDPVPALESPTVWLEALASPGLEPWRMQLCFAQYFFRHAKGKPLNQIVSDVDLTQWLSRRSVKSLEFSSGPPIVDTPMESYSPLLLTLGVRPVDHVVITLVLSPHLATYPRDAGLFWKACVERRCSPRSKVFDVAVTEVYGGERTQWLKSSVRAIYDRLHQRQYGSSK